jgi:uncharacterized protein
VDIEKTFEKLDQQAQPPRKKKRVSDGSGTNATTGSQKTKQKQARCSTSNTPSATANGSSIRQCKDMGTFQHDSDSPTTAAHSPVVPTALLSRQPSHPPSMVMRSRQHTPVPLSCYTDGSTQTDPTDDWYSASTSTTTKVWVPLAKRLLNSRRSAWFEKRRTRCLEQTDSTIDGVESHSVIRILSSEVNEKDLKLFEDGQTGSSTDQADRRKSGGSIESTDTMSISVDIPMPDVPKSNSAPIDHPPQSPPSGESVPLNASTTNEHRAPDLRLQLPPIPSFSSPTSTTQPTPVGSATPLSTNGSIAQSPSGSLHISPSSTPTGSTW